MTAPLPLIAARYRLDRQLGEGGMGVVYAAHDLQLDRPVALKRIRQEGTDPVAQERLQREARAAAAVTHPNVCQVHEITDDGKDLFIVMELLEGESLADRLRRDPLPLATAIPIALAILSALDALHRRGLVHRDLKPGNIFLTPHGVKLLDFGLARPTAGVSEATGVFVTTPGTVLGSPAYMAPEQALNRVVDQRTDLYAVAVTLFEMLSGVSPFARASALETLHAVTYEQPPSLGGSVAIGAVDGIIRRALAKRPEDRFQSAGDMAQALRAVLAMADSGEVVRARPMTRLIVMPFRLLRPDSAFDFLSFSLADAISTTLSGIESLIVRSSLAASAFTDRAFEPKAIAAEAEVDAVLTGSLLHASGQLRLTAQLVATPEGTIVWSHSCQVPVGDIFQLQDDLARRIVESLSIPLTKREQRLLSLDVPASPKAYELYLRANHHFYDSQNWTIARDLYEACLGEDPAYAPAWARVGRCYRLMAKFRGVTVDEQAQWLRRADEAFQKSLRLNDALPLAHNLYTALECDVGRAPDAIARLLRLAHQRTADPELFAGLVHACRYAGLLDASVAAHHRARQLDPRIPTSVAHTYWMKGDYAKAIDDPFGALGYVSALALASLGREEEALAFIRERDPRLDDRSRNYMLALRALLEGDRRTSLEALDRVTLNPDPESLYYVARTFARLGEVDRALAELERVASGYFCYAAFLSDPWLDVLRANSRFLKLLRAVETQHRRAAGIFVEAGGERLLCCSGTP